MKPDSVNDDILILEGEKVSIFALRLADGSCPAVDFLDEMSDVDASTMATAFAMMGSQGFIKNDQRFKQVEGSKVLEFKNFQIRIFCCWAGRGRLCLLFGVRKKKNKHKPADVKRAEEMAQFAKKKITEK